VFWPLLFVATIALVMVFVHVTVRGTVGFDASLVPTPPPGRATIGTLHLWFIYYLLLYCLLTAAVGSMRERISPRIKQMAEQFWQVLGSRWWGFIVLAAPLAFIGSFYPGGLVAPTGSFIPHPAEFFHGGLFYLFGWYLYRSQKLLLPFYTRSWWKYAIAGAVTFFAALVLFGAMSKSARPIPHINGYIAFAYSCTSWLWSFALIGMFLKYLSRQNTVLHYVSESSYWVYLVHMLGTIGFGALIYNLPIGAIGKMGLNIVLTTTACLVTYQLLVRNSFVGAFLNGRRHNAAKPASGVAA
jgi:glucan biosynthesis protein C